MVYQEFMRPLYSLHFPWHFGCIRKNYGSLPGNLKECGFLLMITGNGRRRDMELNISEIRIVIVALRFRQSYMEAEQTWLDDSEEDRISELSDDIYRLEMLTDCLADEYGRHVSEIREDCLSKKDQHFSEVAVWDRIEFRIHLSFSTPGNQFPGIRREISRTLKAQEYR